MRSPLPVLSALILIIAAQSCSDEEGPRPEAPDGNVTPTMVTDSVNSFVSDSGITRYHIEAPLWQIFENADEPHWLFPEGLHLEKFDNAMMADATIQADTARYFTRLKLWRLDGNVRMRNLQGDKFMTHQMFWDQNSHKVYSDSFIHIERTGSILEGYGFISNEQITAYTIRRPTGIIPTSQFKLQPSNPDSLTSATKND
ncbi:MAG: LPS export ABC transporter periplasmic protein LptC [Muribaculaceae bacterium]|nr:LPS export ABC transporter periplasmic protein LptC [Muribaculaceae bacterium]